MPLTSNDSSGQNPENLSLQTNNPLFSLFHFQEEIPWTNTLHLYPPAYYEERSSTFHVRVKLTHSPLVHIPSLYRFACDQCIHYYIKLSCFYSVVFKLITYDSFKTTIFKIKQTELKREAKNQPKYNQQSSVLYLS